MCWKHEASIAVMIVFVHVHFLVTTSWSRIIERYYKSYSLRGSNLPPVGMQTHLWPFKASIRIDVSVWLWHCWWPRGLKRMVLKREGVRGQGFFVVFLMVVCRGQDSCACNSNNLFNPEVEQAERVGCHFFRLSTGKWRTDTLPQSF